VLTDTTPARVGIVADSQLKDQRILFPDPGSAATKAADLFVFVFGSRASRLTRPATRSRCSTPRGWRSGKLPPGLTFDHLDLCWRCQSGGCRFCPKGIADVTRAHHRLH
jgi:hypothetical protein